MTQLFGKDMCGIVGAVAERSVAPILLQGLQRLEYRGYDSAGVAVINEKHKYNDAEKSAKLLT